MVHDKSEINIVSVLYSVPNSNTFDSFSTYFTIMSLVYVDSEKNKRMLVYKGFLHTHYTRKNFNEEVY